MVIMQNKAGRLANRLFAFSHFIANAIEYRYSLINPAFDEYCRYFPSTRQNDFGAWPVSTRFNIKLPYPVFDALSRTAAALFPRSTWHECLFWNDRAEFDLNAPQFIDMARRKTVITRGWLFRDKVNLAKHANEIRAIFAPDESVLDGIRRLQLQARQRADVLVGVHIRRRDYAKWEGGKYCFPDNVYNEKMSQLKTCFTTQGKRVSFLLCSDQPADSAAFAQHDVIQSLGHPIGDLYGLAHCDAIIGPPSTFSMWASFYGEVPLLEIIDGTQVFGLRELQVATHLLRAMSDGQKHASCNATGKSS